VPGSRLSEGRIDGKSYKALTVEEDMASIFQVFNEVYRTGVPNKGFDWKTVRKDGTTALPKRQSLFSEMKRVKSSASAAWDVISPNGNGGRKTPTSEENYKTLFNSSVIGMYVLDVET